MKLKPEELLLKSVFGNNWTKITANDLKRMTQLLKKETKESK